VLPEDKGRRSVRAAPQSEGPAWWAMGRATASTIASGAGGAAADVGHPPWGTGTDIPLHPLKRRRHAGEGPISLADRAGGAQGLSHAAHTHEGPHIQPATCSSRLLFTTPPGVAPRIAARRASIIQFFCNPAQSGQSARRPAWVAELGPA